MIKEIKLPEVSDNVETGDVVKILVKVGDKITVDQPIIELETEKAMFEVPSSEEGTVTKIRVKEGDVIKIGDVILELETEGKLKTETLISSKEKHTNSEETEEGNEAKKTTEEEKTVVQKLQTTGNNADEDKAERVSVPASPSVRRLARELGIDIEKIRGSGSGGRITEENVKEYVKKILKSDTETGERLLQKPLPDFMKWGEIEVQPMSKVRQLTAESMMQAWRGIPMVTQFDKADITKIEEVRKKYSKKIEQTGGKLTITSILVKICSAGLKKFPQFNSSIDMSRNEIIYKKYVNIGIAVDSERGLLVPVIKDSDKKTITDISVELTSLSEKVRGRKITPEEMDGGNFTISNLGGIGGTGFTPIVYSPQVAILGVSRSETEPVYIENKFEPRLILPLTLTYDHRIIDGAEAARFLRWICEVLEDPILVSI